MYLIGRNTNYFSAQPLIMRFKISVPATSANVGPGFDVMGVAFDMFNRFTFETNDVREAIRAVFEVAEENEQVCICNGYTGEVLYHNGEEPWCTDEMALMMLGYLTEQAGAEEEEEEDEPVEVPGVGLVSAFIAEILAMPVEGLPS